MFPCVSTYFHYIHPTTPFPYIFPHPTDTNPPDRTCFTFLSPVVEKKTFCLRYLYREAHYDISIYYILNCPSPLYFSFLP
jgi:hypothetical protein